MWCIPGELGKEYVTRMEDILDLLEKKANPREPIVCLDERPVQLHDEVRVRQPVRPGRIARRDYEYKRCGTANVYAVVAPKEGFHFNKATRNRKGPEFAKTLKRIVARLPKARRIHLVVDNLNTHRLKSLTDYYGQKEGNRLWNRFVVHYTPKHASWLNPAEIEISLLSRECLGRRRFPDFESLSGEVAAWNRSIQKSRRKIQWTFTSKDARRKLGYRRRGVRITLVRH